MFPSVEIQKRVLRYTSRPSKRMKCDSIVSPWTWNFVPQPNHGVGYSLCYSANSSATTWNTVQPGAFPHEIRDSKGHDVKRCWVSGLWRRVDSQVYTNISAKHSTSIFPYYLLANYRKKILFINHYSRHAIPHKNVAKYQPALSILRYVTWVARIGNKTPSTVEISASRSDDYEDVFWDVVQRSLVEIDRRFRDACCVQHSGNFDQTTRRNITKISHIHREQCFTTTDNVLYLRWSLGVV